MIKKVFMVSALVLASVPSASAIGLGAVFGGGGNWVGGGNWGVGVSLGFGAQDAVGWELALRASAGNRRFNINLDTAYHIYQYEFTDWVAVYMGMGPYFGLHTIRAEKDYDATLNNSLFDEWDKNGNHRRGAGLGIEAGVRVPLGVRFMVMDQLDIWLAFVPSLGAVFGRGDYYLDAKSGFGKGWNFSVGGGWGGEIGARWWF
jgi:hypothetical protein